MIFFKHYCKEKNVSATVSVKCVIFTHLLNIKYFLLFHAFHNSADDCCETQPEAPITSPETPQCLFMFQANLWSYIYIKKTKQQQQQNTNTNTQEGKC